MLTELKGGPVQELKFSGFIKGSEVYILRDDLIHPLISGNKWRKLKYIISHMLTNGKNHLITFGGPFSNHLVATAVAGKMAGIRTTGIVRGDEARNMNAFEETCIAHGMNLVHVSRSAYRNPGLCMEEYVSMDSDTEVVGEGGGHPLAYAGCAEILDDLPETYDYIIMSVGTCTTMTGLVKAAAERKLQTRVIGISSLKNNKEPDALLASYPEQYWQMEYDYHRGKYASSDPVLMQFIQKFRNETGIALEHIYTGKAMMALEDMLRYEKIPSGSRILFVHSGGIPALLYA